MDISGYLHKNVIEIACLDALDKVLGFFVVWTGSPGA